MNHSTRGLIGIVIASVDGSELTLQRIISVDAIWGKTVVASVISVVVCVIDRCDSGHHLGNILHTCHLRVCPFDVVTCSEATSEQSVGRLSLSH